MNEKTKQKILKRLSIAEGHLKKVRKMVEGDDYCPDVIHQSQAVQAALKKVDEIILHSHLHTCVLKDIHKEKGKREKIAQEILEVFRKEK